MLQLTIDNDVLALPSVADTAQLRRRHGGYRSSYRKNVCLITFNGSGNGFSYLNFLNGFGGF